MIDGVVALVRDGLLLALLLAAPVLVAALLAGIVTGLVGAFTQIQDPAVALVPRVAAVGAAIVMFAPSIGHQLEVFANRLWPLLVAASSGG
ncbi:MAG TPA: flagellar biosynthetic protein FliQ [Kofleriaceae bacterium]|nr:flagellar biosynthetic protein FliQ [Kofleriaceae bacterium]